MTLPPGKTGEPAGQQDLSEKTGYVFRDAGLLEQALTHRSFAVEQGPGTEDYERLEFLGDAVLELVVSHLLFVTHGDRFREGDLTKMRAFLVNEKQLAGQARKLGLGRLMRLGKGEEMSGGRDKESILADMFEALMGAMYIDGGIDPCFCFVQNVFGDLVKEVASSGLEQDYKSMLQELTQARFHGVPVYRIESVNGPDHRRWFEVALYMNDEIMARGTGKSKKKAEQDAARKALDVLKHGR